MDHLPFSTAAAAVRYMGLLAHPLSEFDSDPNPAAASNGCGDESFEFDESEVIWAADLSDSGDSFFISQHAVPHLSPMTHGHHPRLQPNLTPLALLYKSGLSAALSDEQRSLVRRKSNLNPSISAARFVRQEGRVRFPQSAPLNVPVWPKKPCQLEDLESDGEEEKEGKMIPPHEIVARSHSVAFSVFEGAGRTLKGRDLRRVRNAVFRHTGFID